MSSKSSSSTSSTRRQRPQKSLFSVFLTFLKTENFFSKVQIKYPLIQHNYFRDPVLGVQTTRPGEVMPIWGRSSWITVPNHTILSARRPKLEVPTRRFSWPLGPSPLDPLGPQKVFFDDVMMMLNDVQHVVASIFECSKTVIFEVFQGLIKYQARESRPKTGFLTFFDVSAATRHA